MKVKVGNKIYDSKEEPVMVILSKGERKQIAEMKPEFTKYCQYPVEKYTAEEIREWMKRGNSIPKFNVGQSVLDILDHPAVYREYIRKIKSRKFINGVWHYIVDVDGKDVDYEEEEFAGATNF